MKKSKKTEIPEFILKRWWWRRIVFVDFDEANHTTQRKAFVPEHPSYGFSGEWREWHNSDEIMAFRYELLWRTSFSDLPNWHSLPTWLNGWVKGVLAPKPDRAVFGFFFPTSPSGYAQIKNWMWDLTASDESLCRSFISQINEERERRGLPFTNDPFNRITGKVQKHSEKRRGQRNRAISWLAIEAHDIKAFGLRPLTDGERSRLSKAIKSIKIFETPLRDAVNSAKSTTPINHQTSSGEQTCTRFIRENFEQRFASLLTKR